MSGLHAALEALRDEWLAEPAGSALLHSQAAVRLMHLLDEHPPADVPVATGDPGTEGVEQAWKVLDWTGSVTNPAWVGEEGRLAAEKYLAKRGGKAVVPVATSAAGSSAEDAGHKHDFIGDGSWFRCACGEVSCGVCEWDGYPPGGCPHAPEDAGETHPKFEAFKERHLENPAVRAAYEEIQARQDVEDAGEREVAALREQVAAVADVLSSPRWLGTKSKQARRLKRAIRAALADPASVLAQRDAEVGAKALEGLADELPPWSPPYASLREQGAADGWRHAQDVARERARGLRQGVDR